MAVGGSIEKISIKNRLFPVAADADVSRGLGGYQNETQMNGDGSARMIKTRKPWMLDGIQVEIDNINNDLEFLQDIADGQEFVPVVITYVDGTVYQGRGQIDDEIQSSSQNATAALKLSGPGRLESQS